MNDNPLEDDFSLGDVIQDRKPSSTKMKFILIGTITSIILIALIIIIILLTKNKSSDDKPKPIPREPSKIAEINCIYEIDTTTKNISILSNEFNKSSKFYIFINGEDIPFSKQYKFVYI